MEPHGYLVMPWSAMETVFGVTVLLVMLVVLALLLVSYRRGARRTGR